MKKVFYTLIIIGTLLLINWKFELIEIGVARFEDFSHYKINNFDSPQKLLAEYNINTTEMDSKANFVFINFWATWCGNCIKEIPSINRLNKKYADKGILFVACSDDDSLNSALKLKQLNLNYSIPQRYAVKGLRSKLKRICILQHIPIDTVDGLPCSFVISKNDSVIFNIDGSILGHESEIERRFDSITGFYKH